MCVRGWSHLQVTIGCLQLVAHTELAAILLVTYRLSFCALLVGPLILHQTPVSATPSPHLSPSRYTTSRSHSTDHAQWTALYRQREFTTWKILNFVAAWTTIVRASSYTWRHVYPDVVSLSRSIRRLSPQMVPRLTSFQFGNIQSAFSLSADCVNGAKSVWWLGVFTGRRTDGYSGWSAIETALIVVWPLTRIASDSLLGTITQQSRDWDSHCCHVVRRIQLCLGVSLWTARLFETMAMDRWIKTTCFVLFIYLSSSFMSSQQLQQQPAINSTF